VIREHIARRFQHFRLWWQAPATAKDRVLGAAIGAFGCFWIGVLGRIIFGPMPVSASVLGWWAAASILAGVVLGVLFPKVVSCVCFPFSTFGGGFGT
jgi:hypothetical protein